MVGGGLALLLGLASYALLTYALSREVGADVAAYWNAAERLRDGQPLYVAGARKREEIGGPLAPLAVLADVGGKNLDALGTAMTESRCRFAS